MPPDPRAREPAARERRGAPVSVDSADAAIAADRPLDPGPAPGTAAARGARALGGEPVRVAIVGATGYVGAELVRLLALHPSVEIVGLVGRERKGDPLGGIHPHLATRGLRVYDTVPDRAEAVFLALPHGAVAGRIDEFTANGAAVIDLGADFRLHDPADYPRWYHLEHPRPELLATAVYGLPELHRAELAALGRAPGAIVASPGCYSTATILALAPLARAGLIGDLVVDAKSGVSGAGRDVKPDLLFGEVNESVKAYGIFTHRHLGEIEQELGGLGGGPAANPGVIGIDFLPNLVPMTRGILSAGHVRPTRPVTQARARRALCRRVCRRAVRHRDRRRPGDQARAREQRVPRLGRARRADGSRPGDRRARQPRQGRRGAGGPGVQRRPWPARDGRPAPAAAVAVTLAADPRLAPLAVDRPRVERAARLPAGFRAGGATAGIKASGRPDLALIVADGGPVPAAAVFTPNRFAAAPVRRSRANLQATGGGAAAAGYASAVISTSGSANAATGPDGDADQAAIGEALAAALSIEPAGVLHLSTGIIGTRLPVDRVCAAIERVAAGGLAADDAALADAAAALRTTDTTTKVATATVDAPAADGGSVGVTVSAIAKGVGMIHPRMATMLSVVLTDATADPATLHAILRGAAARTWDQLSVDGDTSTNDTVFLLASGRAGAADAATDPVARAALAAAVEAVARDIARQQAADGEGATALVTCQVSGAADDAEARAVARAVIASSLVKAAVHGRDPNWGRIAGAAGNATLAEAAILEAAGLGPAEASARGGTPARLDPASLRIAIAGHLVYDGTAGGPVPVDKAAASAAMAGDEVLIRLDLGLGDGTGEAFGCDLTEEYVRENSEYTT